MPKICGKRKKTKTHVNEEEELPADIPRSLILKRGRVGNYIKKLVKELRTVMYPYTAINLKESKANTIKDYLSIVDVYGLSHFICLTNTDKASYLKLAKMPKGPTITFRLNDYCLSDDVFSSKQTEKKKTESKPLVKSFNHIPLVIMNGFNSNKIEAEYVEPLNVCSMLLQSFFPPLNLTEIQLKSCKRIVLFNLAFDAQNVPFIEFRHFDIEIQKHSNKKNNFKYN